MHIRGNTETEKERNMNKLRLFITAAAFSAMLMGVNAYAASGWDYDGTEWRYLDSSGYPVTDTWKQSGDKYYYLGSDGYMLRNQLIESSGSYYCLNTDGAMITDSWMRVQADSEDYDLDVSYRWYYFQSNGKAYQATSSSPVKIVTINNTKYGFDDSGKMLFGFVDEYGDINTDDDAILRSVYYFGTNDDGHLYTGWYKYEDGLNLTDYEDKDTLWVYYNDSNGKKVTASNTTNGEKTINGKRYKFDDYGILVDGWSSTTTDDGTVKTKYISEDTGSYQKKSWVYAIPSESLGKNSAQDHEDETYRWFYIGSDGYLKKNCTFKINGKWYVFDAEGRMRTGLVTLSGTQVSGSTPVTVYDPEEVTAAQIEKLSGVNLYYFSTDSSTEGAMKLGTVKIELEDDKYTFGFNSSTGLALNGIVNNKLYRNGILQTAGDAKYAVKLNTADNLYYIVNNSGTVYTKSYVKDADDNYYAVYNNIIARIPAGVYASKAAAQYASDGTLGTYTGLTTVTYFNKPVTDPKLAAQQAATEALQAAEFASAAAKAAANQ